MAGTVVRTVDERVARVERVGVGLAVFGASTRRGHRGGLIAGLVVDNLGSGMFLPLTIVFIVRSVGLSVGVAGTLLAVGTLVGLLSPALVGRVSDRVGPRPVVVVSMTVQAAGMVCYLLAHDIVLTLAAAALVAGGTQTFYSGLFALISDVVGAGPKDNAFAVVAMARAAAFGAGSLLAGLLLTLASTTALRIAVGIDAGSFVVAATLLALFVRPSTTRPQPNHDPGPERSGSVRRDRPFLVLIGTVALLALVTDFFLVGLPVYALTILHTPGWVPGVCLAMLTTATSTLTSLVVRRTAAMPRTTALGIGAGFYILWCLLAATAATLPATWTTPWLLGSTLLLIAGSLSADTRANAIAEAASPPQWRGPYLATFQYAFTIAGLLAPLVVALFTVSTWLPWLIVALSATLGISALPWLTRTLPARATRVDPIQTVRRNHVSTHDRPSA
ncbi:MAG: MFS transporter [Jatrophihabitantaceae bacterium]